METSPEALIDGAESQVSTVRIHSSVQQETAVSIGAVSSDVSSADTEPGWEMVKVKIPRGGSVRQ